MAQCTGTSKQSGQQCRREATPGATVCATHGGKAPQVKAKAAQRLADQAAARELARIGRKRDVHPAEALLELVQWQAGLVDYWRAVVEQVAAKTAPHRADHWGDPIEDDVVDEEDVVPSSARALTWGVTKVKEGGDDRGTTYEAAPHIAYTLLVQAQDKLADYASRALRAGVEERRVRVAEQTGQLVAEVIRAILSELNLTSEQQHLVGEVVPKHLRRLAAVA